MNSIDIHEWSDSIITHWGKKIQFGSGVSLESISQTEKIIGFEFPDSFKIFHNKVNGFEKNDWLESMISVWPLDRIVEEIGRYPNFIGFSDYLINSHVYGFIKGEDGVFKNYDLAEGIPIKIAETFEEAIDLIKNNSDVLY